MAIQTPLRLRTLMGTYPKTKPLKSGDLKVAGAELEFAPIDDAMKGNDPEGNFPSRINAKGPSLLAGLRLLGYRNAFAGIAQPNPASVALHEALGFRPAGLFRAAGFKFGRWHDVGWWQLELQALGRPDAADRVAEECVRLLAS